MAATEVISQQSAGTPVDTDLFLIETAGGLYYKLTRIQVVAAIKAQADAHEADVANPHSVTQTQVGLSALSNDAQLKIASNLSDVNNADTSRENLGVKHLYTWQVAGVLTTGTEKGGAWIVPRALTIEKAYIYCKTTGTVSGNTIVDINKNGTTIFTTQANRPTLAYNDGDKKAVTVAPDVTALAEGDIVTIDIDTIPGGADSADLTILLICK